MARYHFRDLRPDVFQAVETHVSAAISAIEELVEGDVIGRLDGVLADVRAVLAHLYSVRHDIEPRDFPVDVRPFIRSQHSALQFHSWVFERFLERAHVATLEEFSCLKVGLGLLRDVVAKP